MLNRISKLLYAGGRKSRDLRAIEKSIQTGSPMPLIKRVVNKWIGRNIVSKLWWK